MDDFHRCWRFFYVYGGFVLCFYYFDLGFHSLFGGGKVRGINKTQNRQNYNLSILWGQEAGGRRDASRMEKAHSQVHHLYGVG